MVVLPRARAKPARGCFFVLEREKPGRWESGKPAFGFPLFHPPSWPELWECGNLACFRRDFTRVVATEKCRDVLVDCKAAEKAPHLALRGQVKTPYGFVEEQHFRMAHECACNFNPPIHTCAVRAHELAAKRDIQPDLIEETLDLVARIRHVAEAREVEKIFARGPCRLALSRSLGVRS